MLVVFVILAMGLTLLPYLVGFMLDLLSVSVYSLTGWDVGTGFVANTLQVWPGGELISGIAFHTPLTAPMLVGGLLQAMLVGAVCSVVPPLVGKDSHRGVGAMVLLVLVDGFITALVAIGIGYVFNNGPNELIATAIGLPIAGGITLGMVAVITLVIKGFFGRGNPAFAFGLLLAIGKFALITFALIVWSLNQFAGATTTALCLVAYGVIMVIEGRTARIW